MENGSDGETYYVVFQNLEFSHTFSSAMVFWIVCSFLLLLVCSSKVYLFCQSKFISEKIVTSSVNKS